MNIDLINKCKLIIDRYGQCSHENDLAVTAMYHFLTPTHIEVLGQLVNRGPVWDGDIISKSHRSDLIEFGLAPRACVQGEQGYTVANYVGWDVLKAGEGKAKNE